MLKIDVTKPIKNFDGQTLSNGDRPLTFRDVFGTALNATTDREVMSPEDKFKAYSLAAKVYEQDKVELTIDECAFVKERVGLFFSPLIFGRVSDLFEGEGS